MSVTELNLLLSCLGSDLVRLSVELSVGEDEEVARNPNYGAAVTMLCRLFREMPRALLDALAEVADAEGTEIRAEWATPLMRAMVMRLVHEVQAVIKRRDLILDINLTR